MRGLRRGSQGQNGTMDYSQAEQCGLSKERLQEGGSRVKKAKWDSTGAGLNGAHAQLGPGGPPPRKKATYRRRAAGLLRMRRRAGPASPLRPPHRRGRILWICVSRFLHSLAGGFAPLSRPPAARPGKGLEGAVDRCL